MQSVTELDTPAVTIRLDRLEANIARVQQRLSDHRVANRPHIKTHKIPAIAGMQLRAGASGITCQKLGEVEVFVDAGVCDDILLTFDVVGAAKTERLAALAKRVKRLAVVLDSEVVARGISEAARRAGVEIPFLVECDTGNWRNGVQTPQAALDLASLAMKLPGLRFEGLMTYPNRPEAVGFFDQALLLFRHARIPVPVVSGGGTPALATIGNYPMMTEHRAGTYVYNDVLTVSAGAATWDDCAMSVRATVVSRPTPERAVIDTGSKVLTREQYSVKNYGRVIQYPDAVIMNLNEEHGVIDLTACKTRPEIGEVIEIIPNHCCVVSNMMDEVYGIRNGAVEVVWPVAARGKVR